jgi:hypothetical protein
MSQDSSIPEVVIEIQWGAVQRIKFPAGVPLRVVLKCYDADSLEYPICGSTEKIDQDGCRYQEEIWVDDDPSEIGVNWNES